MKMDGLVFFVGLVGNILSVLLFLSPVPTFYRIVKRSSTEEFESFPYISTLLNSCLWIYYGILESDLFVSTVNVFGVFVEAIYIALFLYFAPPRMREKTGMLVVLMDVGFLAVAITGTRAVLKGDLRTDVAGMLCVALNVLMYGSPLSAMKTVLRTKSVEYMPFWLSFVLFLNGGIWTFYALLVRDYFLAAPNGIGFILGTLQLVLYGLYRNSKPSKTSSIHSNGSTEGRSQHEPLILSSSQKDNPENGGFEQV